jgi:hypothetical protein
LAVGEIARERREQSSRAHDARKMRGLLITCHFDERFLRGEISQFAGGEISRPLKAGSK